MNMEPGCNLIPYQELAQTAYGLNLWNGYMAQVTEIALQHTSHFLPQVSRTVIPNDAQSHQFYAFIGSDKTIDSFCIVVVSCDQAELLWAATHKDRQSNGKMSALYNYIENRLFSSEERQISRIIGMCASEDSSFVRQGNAEERNRHIEAWKNTYRFHKKLGYRFTYKLEDYWGEGMHAFVFMKPKIILENLIYGYTPFPNLHLGKKGVTLNSHTEINDRVQRQIRDYLDVFDEEFVKNIPPENSEGNMKGFTGIAFVDSSTKEAAMFAQTSTKLIEQIGLKRKFVYKIEYSALTRLFEAIDSEKPVGVFSYSVSWDDNSELSLTAFFNRFYPSLTTSSEFTVFYSRHEGAAGNYSVLYFVTPGIDNVVWYKPLWRSLSMYSLWLTLEIYNFLSSLRTLDPQLENSDYLHSLIQCVSQDNKIKERDNFQKKLANLRREVQIDKISRTIDTALVNAGHLMTNRLDAIQKHLEVANQNDLVNYSLFIEKGITQKRRYSPRKEHTYLALYGSQKNSDCFQSLQLWGCESLETFWREYADYPRKLERFFKREDDPHDLAKFIYLEARFIIEKRKIANWGECNVKLRVHESEKHQFCLEPEILLPPNAQDQKHYRISDSVLSTVFFEVFLNALRHGMINNDREELGKGYASISVGLSTDSIGGIPVLTFCNEVIISNDEAKEEYKKISLDTFEHAVISKGRGLSLIARGLSQLKIGNIWVRRFTNGKDNFFEVALWLKGLKIKELSQ